MSAGEGAIGAGAYPALAKNSKLRARRYPVYVVVNGSKAMPPFRNLLDDEQVAAVLNYLGTHFGNKYTDTVSAADVKAARHCLRPFPLTLNYPPPPPPHPHPTTAN